MKILDSEALRALDLFLRYREVSTVARKMGLSGYHAARRRIERGSAIRGIDNPITNPSTIDATIDESLEVNELGPDSLSLDVRSDRVLTLSELLSSAEVDGGDWTVSSWSANKWETYSKGGGIVELWQIKASLERLPAWVAEPIRPVKPLPRQAPKGPPTPVSKALVIPDSQNGYKYDPKTQVYTALHDREAWDVAVQVAEMIQPEVIVLLGDMLDLAPFSKYPTDPSLRHTTQPSLLELYWWLSQLRLACPSAQIIFVEGNHESRIYRALVDQFAGEAMTLVPADDPDGPELFSIQRLLGLDSLDIEYFGPYGAEWWLWDRVRVHHGRVVRKGGATVPAVLAKAHHHEMFGHIHRVELGAKRLHGPEGSRVIYAMSPGTLCRVDGVVPAVTPRVDWQQGLGLVQLDHESDQVHMNVMHIEEGVTLYNGMRVKGRDRVAEIREQTGWPF